MSRILIVDDEPAILNIIERVLLKEGHEVTRAQNGREAFHAVDTSLFDFAIVDYDIPPPNGLEVLQRLRNLQPQCLRLLVSGALNLPVALDAVNRGEVVRVLKKPFGPSELLEVIRGAGASRMRLEEQWRVSLGENARQQREWLAECLGGNLLKLAIQPIVKAEGASRVGFEALLRSAHPKLSEPLPLLKVAEANKMLPSVTSLVMKQSEALLASLPKEHRLFINLHPSELSDSSTLESCMKPLQPWASRVVFEITERSSVLALDFWQDSIALLKKKGFDIAVDDVGAGYNSLTVLAELQPRYIKADMSMVRNVDSDVRKRRLIELLCRFAAATGAELIAEGVETQAEADELRSCGADMLQGYLFGHPAPPSEVL
jgi:EAL domain-containing protein (putative c-di-GMP-specific phosphodiesterase class I)